MQGECESAMNPARDPHDKGKFIPGMLLQNVAANRVYQSTLTASSATTAVLSHQQQPQRINTMPKVMP